MLDFFKEAVINGAMNGVVRAYTDHINNIETPAYEKAITINIATLYEAGVDDNTIYVLMQKYWSISREEAAEMLRIERTIISPCAKLEEFLTSQGFNTEYIRNYMISNKVFVHLEHNPELWKLSPNELKDTIERINSKNMAGGT